MSWVGCSDPNIAIGADVHLLAVVGKEAQVVIRCRSDGNSADVGDERKTASTRLLECDIGVDVLGFDNVKLRRGCIGSDADLAAT